MMVIQTSGITSGEWQTRTEMDLGQQDSKIRVLDSDQWWKKKKKLLTGEPTLEPLLVVEK